MRQVLHDSGTECRRFQTFCGFHSDSFLLILTPGQIEIEKCFMIRKSDISPFHFWWILLLAPALALAPAVDAAPALALAFTPAFVSCSCSLLLLLILLPNPLIPIGF